MIKAKETTTYELKSIQLSRLEMVALVAGIANTEQEFMFDQLDSDKVDDCAAFDKKMDMLTELTQAVLGGYTEAKNKESIVQNILYVKYGPSRKAYQIFFILHHNSVEMEVYSVDYDDMHKREILDEPIFTYTFDYDLLEAEDLVEVF